MDGMSRSPTFFVGTEKQKGILQTFQRREQQLAEAYHQNKLLCFNARSYQKTHPVKNQDGHRDADVCLESPMILGVADGVSQVEQFGIDASLLPRELMRYCEDLGMYQLVPSSRPSPQDAYKGPVPLLKEAFEATESLGSTTVVLALMDNSTRIHGKLHPMIAVITVGDCELIVLRRIKSRQSPLEAVFRTEMQRIDGNVQTPLQLARVDERIDPDFYDGITIEVIEKGSAVHCVSAYEGDIVVMGSDGVFDNLFVDEIVHICNSTLERGAPVPMHEALLSQCAKRIVEACHAKSVRGPNGQMRDSPIGRGGKMDDTSVVVAEVIEWTEEHSRMWAAPRRQHMPASSLWRQGLSSLFSCTAWCALSDEDDSDGEFDECSQVAGGPRPSDARPPARG